jgi:hypothetical protein
VTSRRAFRVPSVLKAVECPFLSLYRGNGYWYFIYDNFDAGGRVYESYSIYCYRLNQMDLEDWVAHGRDFVAQLQAGTWNAGAH